VRHVDLALEKEKRTRLGGRHRVRLLACGPLGKKKKKEVRMSALFFAFHGRPGKEERSSKKEGETMSPS